MITLIPLEGDFSIYKLDDVLSIPPQLYQSVFYSITKTSDEISVLTHSNPDLINFRSEDNWKGFKIDGILDFELIGIINDITKPLKDNNITVFVISTFNTDYIFVKKESFIKAIEVFKTTDNINIKSEKDKY